MNEFRRKVLGVAGGLVLGLTSVVVVAQETEVVKIGFSSPLTGPQGHYGKDNQRAAILAVEELNREKLVIGGKRVQFELVSEDDQADPRTGTVVAQRLVDARIKAMIGHFNSGVTIPASKIYSDAGVPQLSVSTNVKYTNQGYKTTFRMMADDDKQGAALAEYAVTKLKLKKFGVIDDRTAYGQGLADAFAETVTKLGAQVVKREYTTDKSTDFRAILTSLKAAKPEALFFGGYDAQGGPMARQMQQLSFKVPLMGGETMNTDKFIELAGPAAEGHYSSIPGAAAERLPKGNVFSERYKGRFGTTYQIYAPYFYDAVIVVAEAMKKADSTDPEKFLPRLKEVKVKGVTAEIEFDTKGDLKKGLISMYQVKNGKWALQ